MILYIKFAIENIKVNTYDHLKTIWIKNDNNQLFEAWMVTYPTTNSTTETNHMTYW